MSWVQDNLFDNPMMAEISRFRSVMKGKSLGSVGIRILLLLAIVLAGLMTWTGVNSPSPFEPGNFVLAQLIFCLITIPLLFYGVIAGERERRSWELLRVAPVSNSQIAMGKIAGMFFMVILVHVIFVLPILYFFATYSLQRSPYSSMGGAGFTYIYSNNPISSFRLLGAELYSLLTSFFVCSLTLFFSARSKRAFTALALTLGCMIFVFIMLPAIASPLVGDTFVGIAMNPVLVVYQLALERHYSSAELQAIVGYACFASALWVGVLAFVFIAYAASTMAFADNLVKFLPNKK